MSESPTGLRHGGMGAVSDTATPAAFTGSLAAAIEDALDLLRKAEGLKPDLVLTDNTPDIRDRRMIFVAIAQGVVNHLIARSSAFHVVVDATSATGFGIAIDVNTIP